MLTIEPILSEELQTNIGKEIPCDIILNDRRIGTFTLYVQPKETYETLYGWADQYDESDYPMLSQGPLARFVNDSRLMDKQPHSFIYIGELEWEIPTHRLFSRKKTDEGCLVDDFIFQLEQLRVTYSVEQCYFSVIEDDVESEQWEFILKGLGFAPASKNEIVSHFVSIRHMCSECTQWIPLKETVCLSCHQQHLMGVPSSS